MSSFAEMMNEGGPLMLVIVGTAAITVLWTMFLSVLGMFRFRVPALLYWGPPVFVAVVGAFGSLWGQYQAMEAMAYADGDMQGTLMAAGHGVALVTRVAGHTIGGHLLIWAALCAAMAAVVRPGEAPKNSIGSALGGAALLGLGGAVLVPVAWFLGAGVLGMGFALSICLVGGFVALVGGMRTSLVSEDADRVAELRLTIAGSLVGAVVLCAYGIVDSGTSEVHRAISMASPSSVESLKAAGAELSGSGWWMMGLGLPLVLMAMSFTVRGSSGRLIDNRSMMSAVATALGWATWFLLLAAFSWQAVSYQSIIPG